MVHGWKLSFGFISAKTAVVRGYLRELFKRIEVSVFVPAAQPFWVSFDVIGTIVHAVHNGSQEDTITNGSLAPESGMLRSDNRNPAQEPLCT